MNKREEEMTHKAGDIWTAMHVKSHFQEEHN